VYGKPGISPLSVMEIVGGFAEASRTARVKNFEDHVLPLFELVPFGVPEACIAGEIHTRLEAKGLRIGVADTVIADTAIARNLVVVTSNLRHFLRVSDLGYPLVIENWREP